MSANSKEVSASVSPAIAAAVSASAVSLASVYQSITVTADAFTQIIIKIQENTLKETNEQYLKMLESGLILVQNLVYCCQPIVTLAATPMELFTTVIRPKVQEIMTNLVALSAEHRLINPRELPEWVKPVGEILKYFYLINELAKKIIESNSQSESELLVLAGTVVQFSKKIDELQKVCDDEISKMQSTTPQLSEEIIKYLEEFLKPKLTTFHKMKSEVVKWLNKNNISVENAEQAASLVLSNDSSLIVEIDAFKKNFQQQITESVEKLKKNIFSDMVSLQYQNLIGDFLEQHSQNIISMITAIFIDMQSLPINYHFDCILRCKRTLDEQLNLATKWVAYTIASLRQEPVPAQTAATPTAIPTAKEVQVCFANIIEADRKKLKQLEQASRSQSAAILTQRQLEEERAKERLAAEQKAQIEQKSRQEELYKSIQNLNRRDQVELNLILENKVKICQQTINDDGLTALFAKLTGFTCTNSSNGCLISFHGKPITSFHRQHGKPIHPDVFTKIKSCLNNLGVDAESVKELTTPAASC